MACQGGMLHKINGFGDLYMCHHIDIQALICRNGGRLKDAVSL